MASLGSRGALVHRDVITINGRTPATTARRGVVAKPARGAKIRAQHVTSSTNNHNHNNHNVGDDGDDDDDKDAAVSGEAPPFLLSLEAPRRGHGSSRMLAPILPRTARRISCPPPNLVDVALFFFFFFFLTYVCYLPAWRYFYRCISNYNKISIMRQTNTLAASYRIVLYRCNHAVRYCRARASSTHITTLGVVSIGWMMDPTRRGRKRSAEGEEEKRPPCLFFLLPRRRRRFGQQHRSDGISISAPPRRAENRRASRQP